MSDLASAAERRNRQYRLAVVSSTFSKVSSFALQAFSIPLVFQTLSRHEYALYLLVTAALATLNLTQMGTGPGLTQALARASATEDSTAEARYFASAFTVSLAFVVLAGLALLAILHLVPSDQLLGQAYASDQQLVIETGDVCIGLVCAHILLSTVDSALAGYQLQVYTYAGSCTANIASAVLVYVVCQHHPTVTMIVLVTFGPPTVARLVTGTVLVAKRPHLLRGFRRVTRDSMAQLFGAGLGFWFVQVASVVEQNAGVLIVGRYASSADLATYGVVYKSVALAIAAASIVTQPLWPAFVEACTRGDVRWIRDAFSRSRRLLVLGASTAALGLIVVGRAVFHRILHVDLDEHGARVVLVFACYLAANVWAHVHYIALMGLGTIWRVAAIILVENTVMVTVGLVLVQAVGSIGMAFAYLVASLVVPCWYLPLALRRVLAALEAGVNVRGVPSSPQRVAAPRERA